MTAMNSPLKFINEQVNQGNNSVNVNNKAGATVNIHYEQTTQVLPSSSKKIKKSVKGVFFRSRKKILIIISALVFVAFELVIPVIINERRISEDRKIRERLANVFNTFYVREDFLSVAIQSHELASIANNHETYLCAKIMEVLTYFLHAQSLSEGYEIYLNYALLAVDTIKKSTDNTSLFYYFAYAIESACYEMLDVPCSDKKWVQVISILELFVENNSLKPHDPLGPLAFGAIYSALGNYFERVMKWECSTEVYDEAAVKMVRYKRLYSESSHNLEHFGVRLGTITNDIQMEAYEAELDLIFLSLSPTSLGDLDNIINGCRSMLNEIGYNQKNELTYIAFTRLIAKALAGKYMIYRDSKDKDIKQMSRYAQECHNTVASLLRLPHITNERSLLQIFWACKDMFMVEAFTEEDARFFYINTMKYLSTDEHKNCPFDDKYSDYDIICYCCKAILDKYGYIEKIYELGFSSAKMLYAYSNILGAKSDEDNMAETYYSYFTEYEKP